MVINFYALNLNRSFTKENKKISFGENTGHFNDFHAQVKARPAKSQKIGDENLFANGSVGEIYSIDGMPDFLIKVNHRICKETPKSIDLSQVRHIPDVFEGRNFGQPIGEASESKGIEILIKQEGEPHSIKNWYHHLQFPQTITTQHARIFAKQVETLARSDDKTYLEFARSLKYLTEKGYKADTNNPNNFLLVRKNNKIKEINMIDVTDWKKNKNLQPPNTYYDMVCPLLDYGFFEAFHSKLSPNDQRKLEKNSKLVVKKCKDAARKAQLPSDGNALRAHTRILRYIDKRIKELGYITGKPLMQRLSDFKERFDIDPYPNSPAFGSAAQQPYSDKYHLFSETPHGQSLSHNQALHLYGQYHTRQASGT